MSRRSDDAVLLFRDLFAAHSAHIALLDPEGVILSVNDAWLNFGQSNGLASDYEFEHVDYLQVCQRAWAEHSPYAEKAMLGLVRVLKAGQRSFSLVYPCHSPTENRWFRMWVQTQAPEVPAVVVAHAYLGADAPAARETTRADRSFVMSDRPVLDARNVSAFLASHRAKRIAGWHRRW